MRRPHRLAEQGQDRPLHPGPDRRPPGGRAGGGRGLSGPATGFFLHPAAALHDTGWGHPEHQGRLRALSSKVERAVPELLERVEHREEFPSAGEEDLLRVHTREHLARIREAVEKARSRDTVLSLTPDTNVSGASWEAAAGSVGAGLAACRAVVEGELRNAFVASRPPGHHATPDRAMGFCLFNHVAVAARTLAEESLERVLILDWDVHHGNGTQDIFYEDPDVFYLSLHQSPHYPGTGAAGERGRGPGEGTTLNVPLPAGTPPDAYVEAFDRAVEEAREAFRPDLLLISAGFDVMAGDPLGGQLLEPEHMELLTRRLVAWAEEDFGGRVVGFLEGGYEPGRLGDGVVSVLRGLVAADDLSTGEGV